MTAKAKRYTPEFKERASRKVVDNSLPVAQVAREFGVSGSTLAFWVKDYRKKQFLRSLPPDTLARIRELERRNRELEQENALLRRSARPRSNSTGSSC
jgi:transposase